MTLLGCNDSLHLLDSCILDRTIPFAFSPIPKSLDVMWYLLLLYCIAVAIYNPVNSKHFDSSHPPTPCEINYFLSFYTIFPSSASQALRPLCIFREGHLFFRAYQSTFSCRRKKCKYERFHLVQISVLGTEP